MPNKNRLFLHLIGNQILSGTATAFIWFALIFWVFLETHSILATSLIAGTFGILNALTAFPFGWIVDHQKKKTVLLFSNVLSVLAFGLGYFILSTYSAEQFQRAGSPVLWLLIIILMFGSIAGNLRMISFSPIVTFLFKPEERDKKNGLLGVSNGITFAITSVLSGLSIGFLGMEKTILFAILALGVSLLYLLFIPLHEDKIVHHEDHPDFKGEKRSTLKLIRQTPGFTGLLFFAIFNNLLGGVFMALMDAYGLSLVSVQSWGILWGFLSIMTIVGGLIASRYGTGKDPLKTLILLNALTWFTCIFFPLKASIVLLAIGGIAWMLFFPIIEASEQTIIQKVIPLKQQGRVIGVMQSLENATAPLTSLFIGPLTQIWIVPLVGGNQTRAMALVFIIAGIFGTLLSILAWNSKYRRELSKTYQKKPA